MHSTRVLLLQCDSKSLLLCYFLQQTLIKVDIKAHQSTFHWFCVNTAKDGGNCRCITGRPRLTFPKSRTSKRSKDSNSSLFLMPNTSLHANRNVRMFFRHRNCVGKTEKVDHQSEQYDILPRGFRNGCFSALTDETEQQTRRRTTALKDGWIAFMGSMRAPAFTKIMHFPRKLNSNVLHNLKAII